MHDAFESPQPLRLFPEKLFYKIGEVSRIVGTESYVLRYWETEFPFLSPRKSKSGQRVYTKKDVDLILQVKRLLYEEKYTIDGVRKKLGGNLPQTENDDEKSWTEAPSLQTNAGDTLIMVRSRLRRMLELLS